MTPEEKAWHVWNENKHQYILEDTALDKVAISMFQIGYQVGRHEMMEKIKESICIPLEHVERVCDR